MQSVDAKTIQVSALEDFNTTNPPAEIHVQMNANTRLDYDLMLFQGEGDYRDEPTRGEAGEPRRQIDHSGGGAGSGLSECSRAG